MSTKDDNSKIQLFQHIASLQVIFHHIPRVCCVSALNILTVPSCIAWGNILPSGGRLSLTYNQSQVMKYGIYHISYIIFIYHHIHAGIKFCIRSVLGYSKLNRLQTCPKLTAFQHMSTLFGMQSPHASNCLN